MDVDRECRTAAYGRPEAFPGEADVSVRLATGPTSVINLITQRAFCRGSIDLQHIEGAQVTGVNAVALSLLDGAAWLDDGQRIDPGDILVLGSEAPQVFFEDAVVASLRAWRA
jgi:environmental stress-induced protein Ves